MASGVLAEYQIVDVYPDALRSHYLVCLLVGHHSVLMDACLVGKGVFAYDRLVERCGLADDVVHSLACPVYLSGIDPCPCLIRILAGMKSHYHFFKRSIACPLSETVDSYLDLPCSAPYAGKRVGGCQAEVVMTMH